MHAAEHISASDALRTAVGGISGEQISLGEMVRALGDRSFGLLLLLMALPNCIPAPPGLTSVFGIPLLFVAVQLAMGRQTPWLPRWLARKEFDVADVSRIVARAVPYLQKVERFCRPRAAGLFGPAMDRAIGALVVLLAASIIIPLPFTNGPPAWGAALLSCAVIERDALLLAIGAVIGVAGLVLTSFVIGSLVALLTLAF